MARAADRRGLHAEFRFGRLQDGVGGVAVRADRSFAITGSDRLAVNAALIIRFDHGVAFPACLRDAGLGRRAVRVLMAENVVRPMAALAIGRHQQALFAQRGAVNRVHVHGIHIGQAVLFRQLRIAMARAAGARNVERVDSRAGVVFEIDGVGAAMATGAGVAGVDAAAKLRGFVRVATLALNHGNVVRVRIPFDIRMAVIALEAAMDAGGEDLSVDGNAVTCGIRHAGVAVAGEAFGLRPNAAGRHNKRRYHQGERQDPAPKKRANVSQCGFHVPAVFFLQADVNRSQLACK